MEHYGLGSAVRVCLWSGAKPLIPNYMFALGYRSKQRQKSVYSAAWPGQNYL